MPFLAPIVQAPIPHHHHRRFLLTSIAFVGKWCVGIFNVTTFPLEDFLVEFLSMKPNTIAQDVKEARLTAAVGTHHLIGTDRDEGFTK